MTVQEMHIESTFAHMEYTLAYTNKTFFLTTEDGYRGTWQDGFVGAGHLFLLATHWLDILYQKYFNLFLVPIHSYMNIICILY